MSKAGGFRKLGILGLGRIGRAIAEVASMLKIQVSYHSRRPVADVPWPYHASVLADYLRRHLLARRMDFTFETVMSSPDKVAFLSEARAAGYRTYLYYVATDDPIINVSRVRSRVSLGGHTVPETKIIERYNRSLSLLRAAVANTSRAYVFDNSGNEQQHVWLAEVTEGRKVEIKSDRVPAWLTSSLLSPS